MRKQQVDIWKIKEKEVPSHDRPKETSEWRVKDVYCGDKKVIVKLFG